MNNHPMTSLFSPLCRLAPVAAQQPYPHGAAHPHPHAEDGHAPGALMAEYYAQRASAGLIVAEATWPWRAAGFLERARIHSPEQIALEEGHRCGFYAAGGRIVLQIWHGGRACHPLLNDGRQAVAPSAIAIANDEVHAPGQAASTVPRALRDDELPAIVAGLPRQRSMQRRPVSTASRCMAPTATCSTSSCGWIEQA